MGLASLYLFTLLGGVAAGTYAFDAVFRRTREGARPWLVPLVVVLLFAVGLIAATTHVHSIPRAVQSVLGGTANAGSGMMQEVVAAGCFFVLAVIDLVVTCVKKNCPWGLRIAGAVLAVVCVVLMGAAYTDIYGVAVWCNAPATILSFVAGALSMGLALFAVLSRASYDVSSLRISSLVVNALLAVGLCLEIAAFSGEGKDPIAQIAGLAIAPVASIALVALASKFQNKNVLAIAVCAVSVVGVAIARYAFYALGAAL